MKIKILFLTWSLERGGAERFLAGLLDCIDLDKFDPVLCCLNWKGEWAGLVEARGIKVIEMQKKEGFDFDLVFRLKKVIEEGKFDIVNTHLWSADTHGRLAAILARTPVIVSTAQNVDVWKRWFHHWLDRILGWKTKRVVAVSQAVKDYYHDVTGMPPRKICVIPNAVDISLYENPEDPSYLYEEWGLSDQDFVLACVGRLEKQKGHPYLFQSLAAVKKDFPLLKILVVGKGTLQSELETLVKDLGIADRVRFTGQRKDIAQILQLSRGLVLPSLFEGLPLCVLEAMAAGRPVIATDVGGTAELVSDGLTGFIVSPKDTESLTQAIKRLMTSPDQARKMGEEGRKIVQEKFSIQAVTKQTEELFINLVKET